MTEEKLLDADQQAVALKTIRDMQFGLATIGDCLKREGYVDAELARSVLRVSEYHLADLGKLLGIQTQTANEIEERNANVRAANIRVRELESMLGAAQSHEAIQMGLKSMANKLNAWWNLEGFGHISDIDFGQYGCAVNFSCHLFGTFRLTNSRTPVSDKERRRLWHETLVKRGYVLTEEDRETQVCDCDRSRKTLTDLFKARIPSAQVTSFENHSKADGSFVMRGVKVYIRNIAEILALPLPDDATA